MPYKKGTPRPPRKRPPKELIPCSLCGETFLARPERTHDFCHPCQRKRQSARQKWGAEVELEHWQVEMYLDAMVRQENLPPWERRKIR